MRLINAKTRKMEEFIGTNIPKYAILSHTWEEDEVTFNDMMTNMNCSKKKGYEKIDMTCNMAVEDDLDYAWVDTCCIDKSSSAELSEAINSMYQWYERSAICYAYLSDLDPSTPVGTSLKDCRWLTRGWTLQELIAPKRFYFYDSDWGPRGSKKTLVEVISRITGIDVEILLHKAQLSSLPVGHRMAWAASRETTRIEDRAYSLLGIFDVNMPMLYGEGEKAFRRLQEEIIKLTPDLSLFAWRIPAPPQAIDSKAMVSGILARSPDYFRDCLSLRTSMLSTSGSEISILNGRLKTRAGLYFRPSETMSAHYFLPLGCQKVVSTVVIILLKACGANEFVRCDPWCTYEYPADHAFKRWSSPENMYILADVPRDYEAETGIVGAYPMRRFLLDRSFRIPVLHIKTPPEVRIDSSLPPGRYDPVDQLAYCPYDTRQEPIFLGLDLSIKPEFSKGIVDHQLFQYGLVVLNWGQLSRHNSSSSLTDAEPQFAILDMGMDGMKGMDLFAYFVKRSGNILNLLTVRWLNGHGFLRASSTISPLHDRPDMGVRVSVTSKVVRDIKISRTKFVRLSISWEIGKIEDLPVSEPKEWDLPNVD